MAKRSDPDDVQAETASGARGTKLKIDGPRDDSSLEVGDVRGKDLGKGTLAHSLSGTNVAN